MMVTERKDGIVKDTMENCERYNRKLWKIFISGKVYFNSALVVWLYGLKFCEIDTHIQMVKQAYF
jgi:hypothetical protein